MRGKKKGKEERASAQGIVECQRIVCPASIKEKGTSVPKQWNSNRRLSGTATLMAIRSDRKRKLSDERLMSAQLLSQAIVENKEAHP